MNIHGLTTDSVLCIISNQPTFSCNVRAGIDDDELLEPKVLSITLSRRSYRRLRSNSWLTYSTTFHQQFDVMLHHNLVLLSNNFLKVLLKIGRLVEVDRLPILHDLPILNRWIISFVAINNSLCIQHQLLLLTFLEYRMKQVIDIAWVDYSRNPVTCSSVHG